jgi:hypothetical protein
VLARVINNVLMREELRRLLADYDAPVTRRKADIRVRVICSRCHRQRLVSSLAFQISCRRCGAVMVPWWLAHSRM